MFQPGESIASRHQPQAQVERTRYTIHVWAFDGPFDRQAPTHSTRST
jgi:hypothetical protein